MTGNSTSNEIHKREIRTQLKKVNKIKCYQLPSIKAILKRHVFS